MLPLGPKIKKGGSHIQELNIDRRDMDSRHIFNFNSLYIESNGKTEEETKRIISEVVRNCPGVDFDPALSDFYYFRFARECNKNGEKKDEYWVYVNDVRIYNYIIGFNPDGTPRDFKDLSDVSPDLYKQYLAEKKILDAKSKSITDWTDLSDVDDELNIKYGKHLHLCTHPEFSYVQVKDSHDWQKHTKPDTIAVMRGYVSKLKHGLINNKLMISGLPATFDMSTVPLMFGFFSTSEDETYPKAHFAKNGNLYLEYDPDTYDASFAHTVLKRYDITIGGYTYTLRTTYVQQRSEKPTHGTGGYGQGYNSNRSNYSKPYYAKDDGAHRPQNRSGERPLPAPKVSNSTPSTIVGSSFAKTNYSVKTIDESDDTNVVNTDDGNDGGFIAVNRRKGRK